MKLGSRLRRLAQAAGCVALTMTAGLLLAGYFDGLVWLLPVLGAALAGGVVAGATGLWRRDVLVVVLVVLAGGAVLAVLPVLPGGPRPGEGLGSAVVSALRSPLDGWSRMLTVGVPAPPTAALLVLPVVLSWAAALLATVATLRTRSMLLPLLPPFLFFVLNLLLTSAQARPRLGLTALFLGVALTLAFARATAGDTDPAQGQPVLAAPAIPDSTSGAGGSGEAGSTGDGTADRADSDRTGSRAPGGDAAPARADVRRFGPVHARATVGRVALGVPAVAVTAVLGLALAAALPTPTDPFDPRSLREPPVTTIRTLSPLISLKSQLIRKPAVPVFDADVRTTRPLGDSLRLRVAALTDYDGVLWSATGHFARPAAHLPSPETTQARGATVSLDVHVQDLPGELLPAAGQPVTVRAPSDAEVDVATGTVAAGKRPLPDYRYSVSGVVPIRDTDLPNALPSGDAATSIALPPDLPHGVREFATRRTAAFHTPYFRLKALESYLRDKPYSVTAPGESYAAVERTLLAEPKQGASFAEQHAAAFAVMARSLGLPTRVAVGYLVGQPRVQTGHISVTTADAWAWPEVHFEGYGWIPFEPTNPAETPPQGKAPPADPTYAPGVLQKADVEPGLAPARPQGIAERARSEWPWVLVAIAVLTVATAVGVWVVKARRRRRRRGAGTASQRIVGAWSESVDRLVESGITPMPALTPAEVRGYVESKVGAAAGTPLAVLAPLVDEAVFAPWESGEESVERAWACERELTGALRTRTPVALRWRRHVDPRPLLIRRPSGRAGFAGSPRGPARHQTSAQGASWRRGLPSPIRIRLRRLSPNGWRRSA